MVRSILQCPSFSLLAWLHKHKVADTISISSMSLDRRSHDMRGSTWPHTSTFWLLCREHQIDHDVRLQQSTRI